MARARRLKGAWGNALGGYKRQKRNNLGQFSKTGAPVKRAKAPTFKKGGQERYYAPGGKTYAKKKSTKSGFAPSGDYQSKAARRQAGYERAMAKKAAQQKAARRRKMVVGSAVVAAAVVGGVAYHRHSKANRPEGPLASRRQLQITDAMSGRTSRANAADPMDALRRLNRNPSMTYTRPGASSAVPPSPPPPADDGYSPAKARVLALGAGTGTAASVIRNVADAQAEMKRLSRIHQNAKMDEDGVSSVDRYRPNMQRQGMALNDVDNYSELNLSLNSRETLGFAESYGDREHEVDKPKGNSIGQKGSQAGAASWEKQLRQEGVVIREVGSDRDEFGEAIVKQGRRAPADPDEPIGSGRAVSGVLNTSGLRWKEGGLDIHENLSYGDGKLMREESRIQAEYADQLKIGPNAGRAPAGKNIRRTSQPVKVTGREPTMKEMIESGVVGGTRKKFSEMSPSAQRASASYEHRQAARRKLNDKHNAAFPASNADTQKYYDGVQVGVVNAQQAKFDRDLRTVRLSEENNPVHTGYLERDQAMSLSKYERRRQYPDKPLNKRQKKNRDRVRGDMRTTAISRTPEGEARAEKWLEDMNKRVAGGAVPSRYDREMMKFLNGERNTPPVREEVLRNRLDKKTNAKINRRARQRNASRKVQ